MELEAGAWVPIIEAIWHHDSTKCANSNHGCIDSRGHKDFLFNLVSTHRFPHSNILMPENATFYTSSSVSVWTAQLQQAPTLRPRSYLYHAYQRAILMVSTCSIDGQALFFIATWFT